MANMCGFGMAGEIKVVSLEKQRLHGCQLSGVAAPGGRKSLLFTGLQKAEQRPLRGSLGRQILIQKEDGVSRIIKEAQNYNACITTH